VRKPLLRLGNEHPPDVVGAVGLDPHRRPTRSRRRISAKPGTGNHGGHCSTPYRFSPPPWRRIAKEQGTGRARPCNQGKLITSLRLADGASRPDEELPGRTPVRSGRIAEPPSRPTSAGRGP